MKDRMPPLQGLYYFFIAAKEGSFKTAAKNLFVTPAAISQQIRQLEEFLGTDLFVRQHRKIVLTPEGELLFTQAERGFAHLQQGVRLVNQIQTRTTFQYPHCPPLPTIGWCLKSPPFVNVILILPYY